MRLFNKIGLMVAIAACVCGYARGIGALPANEIETEYFSDSTFTVEVGSSFLACNGGHFREGRTSRFVVRLATPCHGAGGSEIACVVDGVSTTCPPSICDSELFDCN